MKDLGYVAPGPNTGGWQDRHIAAVTTLREYPRPTNRHERAIVGGLKAWIAYAEAHEARYESPIGEDGVLGPAWAQWGWALRTLLNGETGRLDCGTLDTIILDNLTEMGFEE